MPGISDPVVIASVTSQIMTDLATIPPGAPPGTAIAAIVNRIYAGIAANAIVDPVGAVPMNVIVAGTPTPVTGTGKIT